MITPAMTGDIAKAASALRKPSCRNGVFEGIEFHASFS